MNTKVLDWESLSLPDYEDQKETAARLQVIADTDLVAQPKLQPKHKGAGFSPSPEQARQVATMSCLGLTDKAIGQVLNIDLKTLKFYYTKELKTSGPLANAMVARVALSMAMDGQHADMTKFWLKTRANWKETSAVELTGKDGAPIETTSAKDRLKGMLAAKPVGKG
jgi:uncharacterized OsmC-like protein